MSTVGEAHVIRVLVVEDTPDHQLLVREKLSAVRVAHFELTFVERLDAALEKLAEGGIDVVLLDLCLPDANGLEGVVGLRADAPSVPIVVHSASDDEVLARAAVNVGAQDFVVKGSRDPNVLARTLRYAVDRQSIIDELTSARQALATSLEETRRAYQMEHRSALRLQELNQLINDFVGMASHDLRAPLTVIGGYALLMLDERRSVTDEQRREFLEIIVRNTKDMGLLIADILDVSAIESGSLSLEMNPFDLVAMVRTSASELAVGAGRQCCVEVPDARPLVLGDERRHRQVLCNLVTNSFKFAPADAPVEITVTPREKVLEVQVRDHGIGIADSDVPKLFRRFSPIRTNGAAKGSGTGLGLYITKSLVEAQGGTISVESCPGEGSTFTYTAPLAS